MSTFGFAGKFNLTLTSSSIVGTGTSILLWDDIVNRQHCCTVEFRHKWHTAGLIPSSSSSFEYIKMMVLLHGCNLIKIGTTNADVAFPFDFSESIAFHCKIGDSSELFPG